MKVMLVDNRDSFTFNLSQLIANVTATEPLVIANTEERWRDLIDSNKIEAIVISPGPGTPERPEDFGICLDLILDTRIPVLGVCLGHQGLGYAYGASVVPAPVPMHGRISQVTHNGSGLFEGVPTSFAAVRYHSLCLRRDSIPACLDVTAATDDGIPMALEHVGRPQFGVQFHPESVAANFGERLIRNFLRIAAAQKPPRHGGRNARSEHLGRPPCVGAQTARSCEIAARVLDQWVEPQAAFERLFVDSKHAYWLDSSAFIPGHSRFSIMGDASGPHSSVLLYRTQDRTLTTLRCGQRESKRVESLVAELRERLASPVRRDESLPFDFQTGFVGYLGYELRNEFGSPTERVSALPDAAFIDADRCVVFDHAAHQVFLVARVANPGETAEPWFDRVTQALFDKHRSAHQPRISGKPVIARLADGPNSYLGKIRHCQDQLAAGESYQICLSSEFRVNCGVAPFDAYRALRAINPAPYAAYLRFGDTALLSSSPERFLRVGPDRLVTSKPIKGTSPRGATADSDAMLMQWLRNDEKSRSENLMIVDLLRNDIGRVASTASVHAPKLMDVESYATVHQLVSTVAGHLRPDRDCLDCLAAAFPGGSMTGAPKLRTMSIIDRLEQRARGPYSGAIGFLSYGDRMDLSIVIRTIVMTGSKLSIGSGGGIVAMSDPIAEFEEMVLKARAPLSALAAASAGDAEAWELRYCSP